MAEPKDDKTAKTTKIWDSVSEGREVFKGEWGEGDSNTTVTSLISEDSGPYGSAVASSYPHLTQASSQRPQHVTSSRLVDDRDPKYLIHQRYSQDNDKDSKPIHDRFFAVERDSGMVRTAVPKLIASTPKVHVPSKVTAPMRGSPIGQSQDYVNYFTFEVGTVDDHKHPPLSPRSRDRKF